MVTKRKKKVLKSEGNSVNPAGKKALLIVDGINGTILFEETKGMDIKRITIDGLKCWLVKFNTK